MTLQTFETFAQLRPLIGQEVAVSDWITITQEQVNLFAQATGDHQWIHVDVARATAGPFGGPIAHGFLTLSLLPRFMASSLTIAEAGMGVNYGLNKVRFTAPVPVGGRLRARMKLLACDSLEKNCTQVTWAVTTELEGSDKPVCVAEFIARHYA